MPTNLNALIRYKQIDKELKNPYVKTTIRSLQEACTKQLEEFRGIYKLVSERTIRDDIRVMRSGALGYYAPIVVEDGVYSYSDAHFSIYKEEVQGLHLLKEVMQLLLEEREQIKNPKLFKVLKELSEKTGIPVSGEAERVERSFLIEDIDSKKEIKSVFKKFGLGMKEKVVSENSNMLIPTTVSMDWRKILELIGS